MCPQEKAVTFVEKILKQTYCNLMSKHFAPYECIVNIWQMNKIRPCLE
jgi:hypothetical protein